MAAPVHRWGDASTYYMQIQSISNDFDIQYQSKDIERALETQFDDFPSGLFLIKTEEGNYYYGKEFSYALFASPFYKILGKNGILFFNGLMFFMMILMGYLYLRTENENKIALSVSVLYFTMSTAFVYIFWIHAEIYNMFLIMASLFLWERYFKNKNPKYLFIASFVFGLAFVAKVPNILLFIPMLFYELHNKRFKNSFMMLFIFMLPVITIYGYFFLNTGSLSFYGGDRLYYIHSYPFVEGYDNINEAGKPAFSVSENRLDALMNEDNLKVIPYNLFYYIFGRFTGMFWYYPFTLFALISVFTSLSNDSKASPKSNFNNYISSNADKILIFTGIILYIVFFCTIIGNNYLGGQHAVGNRYFYIYPAFIYLIRKIDLKNVLLVISIAVLTLNPIILDPIGNSINPSSHQTSIPYSYLPLEYTQLNNLPFWYNSHKIDDMLVYRLDDKSKESGGAFTVSGSADMVLKSKNEIETLLVILNSKNSDMDAHISVGSSKNSIDLNKNEISALAIKDLKPAYVDKRYFVYAIRTSSPNDLVITLKDVSSKQTNLSVFFLENWYTVENWDGISSRWISNNATILMYSKENRDLPINFEAMSYYIPRTLEIYNNEELEYAEPISTQPGAIETNISLEEGINLMRFHVPEGCLKPSDIEDSDDRRCLSLAFQNIDFES